MNVDLTVWSVVAETHDSSTFTPGVAGHRVSLGHIRCRATNSHESYDWTVSSPKDVPRIGDIVTVRMEPS